MIYKTSKEIAKKWGITPKRVNVLAKEGRIKDAKLIGNTWMIPSDSTKPSDKRYTKNQGIEKHYRFPLITCQAYGNETFVASLTHEEKKLLYAEEKFHENKRNEVYKTFLELYETTKEPYIKINALYHITFTNLLDQHFEEYKKYFAELSKLIDDESNNHKELILLKRDITLLTNGNVDLKFGIDSIRDIRYTVDSYAFITIFAFYENLIQLLAKRGNKNLKIYEYIISSFNKEEYPYIINILETYIALMYLILEDYDNMNYHLEIAVDLAYRYKVYNTLSEVANYIVEPLNKIFEKYPPVLKETIYEGNKLFIGATNAIAAYYHGSNIPTLLATDYKYIGFAFNGMSNKEIAINLNISESAVSKKFNYIFRKFNVKNKYELVKKFSTSASNPNLIMCEVKY